MFVASTGRSASTRMSTSGWLRRSSNATKTPRTATPPSSATIVFPEPQPHAFAFEMPSSSAASPSESSAAPRPVDPRALPRRRGRDDAMDEERRGQREQPDPEEPGDVGVVDDGARQGQADAAADAEHRRDHPDGHRAPLGRELVVDDPEGEREHPARDALDDAPGDDHLDRAARARETIEPKEKMSSTPVSTRALPNRSPSLPASGVHTEAESRNPVSTQDVVEDSVPNSRVRAGIAGATSVCARA